MPPTAYSRFRFCSAISDEQGKLILTDPEPFLFRTLADNITATVTDGDSLTRLAYRYYGRADLWWVIGHFAGVHDPTIKLAAGTQLTFPSALAVGEIILNETRRVEFQA